jgi:hypothetical protein
VATAKGEVEQIYGVYEVPEAEEPCYLVELEVISGGWRIADITQEEPGQPRENWQSPWDLYVLTDAGEVYLHESKLPIPGEVPDDKTRCAFFFHYLDPSRPLETPWGQLALPEPSPRPSRLDGIEYEQP